MAKIIVSYDGSDYDRDALAFGKLLARTGAKLELAYVRHAHESKATREQLAEHEAEELLASGARPLRAPAPPHPVVVSGSTPGNVSISAMPISRLSVFSARCIVESTNAPGSSP